MSREVWVEGFLLQEHEGAPSGAKKLGDVHAGETFFQACERIFGAAGAERAFGHFDPHHMTVWGLRLFDNEFDARKRYG